MKNKTPFQFWIGVLFYQEWEKGKENKIYDFLNIDPITSNHNGR